jgi:transcriptional regulator with XRE-family HTH domain
MAKFDRRLIGDNIRLLREAMGISQLNFSHLIDISLRTIANIEAGIGTGNLNTLERILTFFNLEVDNLVNHQVHIPLDFREKIIERHKSNKELLNLLLRKPTIVYAIKYKLLKSDFLNTAREINEVKAYFERFGWSFLGTSISNALKRMPDQINIEPHPSKKGTSVYSKK